MGWQALRLIVVVLNAMSLGRNLTLGPDWAALAYASLVLVFGALLLTDTQPSGLGRRTSHDPPARSF